MWWAESAADGVVEPDRLSDSDGVAEPEAVGDPDGVGDGHVIGDGVADAVGEAEGVGFVGAEVAADGLAFGVRWPKVSAMLATATMMTRTSAGITTRVRIRDEEGVGMTAFWVAHSGCPVGP